MFNIIKVKSKRSSKYFSQIQLEKKGLSYIINKQEVKLIILKQQFNFIVALSLQKFLYAYFIFLSSPILKYSSY